MTNTAARTASIAGTAPRPRVGLFSRLWRAYEMRVAERQLRELDDRMLRDMGISRGELERVVRGDR